MSGFCVCVFHWALQLSRKLQHMIPYIRVHAMGIYIFWFFDCLPETNSKLSFVLYVVQSIFCILTKKFLLSGIKHFRWRKHHIHRLHQCQIIVIPQEIIIKHTHTHTTSYANSSSSFSVFRAIDLFYIFIIAHRNITNGFFLMILNYK